MKVEKGMMTDDELNKRIHEILDMCWHEDNLLYECSKCGNPSKNIDFTTSWEGFGILVEWWMKQDYRKVETFLTSIWSRKDAKYKDLAKVLSYSGAFPLVHMSPVMLAEDTVEFFEGEN